MRIGIGHAETDPDAGRLGASARALADALLGAAGLGDGGAAPGPAREPDPAGAGESCALERLSRAVRAVEGQNYQVVNVDLTVTGEGGAPADRGGGAPERDAVRSELAERLHVPPGHVSLESAGKGSRPASAGRGGGVTAVALLDRIAPMDRVHSTLRAGG